MALETGDFNDRDLEVIPKIITVLKYLNQGREITFDQWTVKIGETHKGGIHLLWKTTQTSSEYEGEKEVWLGMDVTLQTFSEMCNKLDEKEIITMQANMALQSFNKTR